MTETHPPFHLLNVFIRYFFMFSVSICAHQNKLRYLWLNTMPMLCICYASVIPWGLITVWYDNLIMHLIYNVDTFHLYKLCVVPMFDDIYRYIRGYVCWTKLCRAWICNHIVMCYNNLWINALYWYAIYMLFVLLSVFDNVQWNIQALQWRQNGRDGVSNHQPHDCLLNRLFGRRSNKTSKLRVPGLCAGNSPGTGEFPAQRSSNAKIFPFDDVMMGVHDVLRYPGYGSVIASLEYPGIWFLHLFIDPYPRYLILIHNTHMRFVCFQMYCMMMSSETYWIYMWRTKVSGPWMSYHIHIITYRCPRYLILTHTNSVSFFHVKKHTDKLCNRAMNKKSPQKVNVGFNYCIIWLFIHALDTLFWQFQLMTVLKDFKVKQHTNTSKCYAWAWISNNIPRIPRSSIILLCNYSFMQEMPEFVSYH